MGMTQHILKFDTMVFIIFNFIKLIKTQSSYSYLNYYWFIINRKYPQKSFYVYSK